MAERTCEGKSRIPDLLAAGLLVRQLARQEPRSGRELDLELNLRLGRRARQSSIADA